MRRMGCRYFAVGQADAVVFGYGRRGGYASILAFQHVSGCKDPSLAQIGEINGILFAFPLVRIPIAQSLHHLFPRCGACPHLQCEIGKPGTSLRDRLFVPLRSIVQFCGNGQVFAVISANHAAFLLLERSVGKFRVVCGQCQIT